MGVALCLGVGTTIGYKRIVVTVAEKIGKTHLTYAQGACAELVAMATIALADVAGLPVSTTHVLSSGVAGTMWANRSGLQLTTIRKIALAWVLTLPGAMLLAAALYVFGHFRARRLARRSRPLRSHTLWAALGELHNGLRKRASSTSARIPPSGISQSRSICARSAPWTRRA